MNLAERLRTSRSDAGLSQSDVAKVFGISRAAVAQWESDKEPTEPAQERFPQLASLYSVSLLWLMTGQGSSRGGLSSDEAELLRIYRDLEQDERPRAIGMLELLKKPTATEQPRRPFAKRKS